MCIIYQVPSIHPPSSQTHTTPQNNPPKTNTRTGPLIGGLMMDHLPKTRELGCTPASVDDTSCYSAFPAASVAFGLAGFACAGLLMLGACNMSW